MSSGRSDTLPAVSLAASRLKSRPFGQIGREEHMEPLPPYRLVLTTCPEMPSANRIAQALVQERLAACVNVLPPMQSVYRWRGQIETASEHLLIIKIRADDYPAVEQRIRALHSYELPEVIAVPLVGGLAAYLAWLDNPDTPA